MLRRAREIFATFLEALTSTPSPEDRRDMVLRRLRRLDREQSQAALLLWAPLIPDEKLSEAQAALTVAFKSPQVQPPIDVEPMPEATAQEKARERRRERRERERQASEYARVVRSFLLYGADDDLDHLEMEERQSLLNMRRLYLDGALRAAGVHDEDVRRLQAMDLDLLHHSRLRRLLVGLDELAGTVSEHESQLLSAFGCNIAPGTTVVDVFLNVMDDPFLALIEHRRRGVSTRRPAEEQG